MLPNVTTASAQAVRLFAFHLFHECHAWLQSTSLWVVNVTALHIMLKLLYPAASTALAHGGGCIHIIVQMCECSLLCTSLSAQFSFALHKDAKQALHFLQEKPMFSCLAVDTSLPSIPSSASHLLVCSLCLVCRRQNSHRMRPPPLQVTCTRHSSELDCGHGWRMCCAHHL